MDDELKQTFIEILDDVEKKLKEEKIFFERKKSSFYNDTIYIFEPITEKEKFETALGTKKAREIAKIYFDGFHERVTTEPVFEMHTHRISHCWKPKPTSASNILKRIKLFLPAGADLKRNREDREKREGRLKEITTELVDSYEGKLEKHHNQYFFNYGQRFTKRISFWSVSELNQVEQINTTLTGKFTKEQVRQLLDLVKTMS